MKIALYIEDGLEQIVLTPDTDTEKSILAKLLEPRSFEVKKGNFYHCQGGWMRHGTVTYSDVASQEIDSIMIVMREKGGDAT